jgi:hypothetical protein
MPSCQTRHTIYLHQMCITKAKLAKCFMVPGRQKNISFQLATACKPKDVRADVAEEAAAEAVDKMSQPRTED